MPLRPSVKLVAPAILLSAGWLTATLWCPNQALAQAEHDGQKTSFFDGLLKHSDVSLAAELRSLGRRTDAQAAERLIEIAKSTPSTELGPIRVIFIHALAGHSSGPYSSEIVLLLRDFALGFNKRDSNARSVGQTSSDATPEQLFDERVRATAIFALSLASSREAFASLLSAAGQNKQQDPLAYTSAREAISLHPPTAAQLSSLTPLVGEDILKKLSPAQPVASSPVALIEAAKSSNKKYRELVFAAAEMLARGDDFAQISADNDWPAAHEHSALWALRSLALLSPELTKKQKKFALKAAEQSLNSKSEPEQRAAHWLKQLLEAAKKKTAAKAPTISPESEQREFSAQEKAAWSKVLVRPDVWLQLSTRELWRLRDKLPLHLTTAPLSQRAFEAQLSTDLLRDWLSAEDARVRAAVAWGLGRSNEAGAFVLLQDQYFKEENAQVRAAIVNALRRLSPASLLLERVAQLDPDSACRTLAQSEKSGFGFYLAPLASETFVIDHVGRSHPLKPAKDGFAAVVHPDL